MENTYRWENPYEWLAQKARDWNAEELYEAFTQLAAKTDSDTLQDLYQDEMERDGYFVSGEGFLQELFEFENCDECQQGAENHEPIIVAGNWFARCKTSAGQAE